MKKTTSDNQICEICGCVIGQPTDTVSHLNAMLPDSMLKCAACCAIIYGHECIINTLKHVHTSPTFEYKKGSNTILVTHTDHDITVRALSCEREVARAVVDKTDKSLESTVMNLVIVNVLAGNSDGNKS